MNWISTKERLPEPDQQIALTIIDSEGYRQYHTDRPWPYQLEDGKLTFGHCTADYWMPLTDPTAL